jgi:tetratricopeptide (TPR) repeat protein
VRAKDALPEPLRTEIGDELERRKVIAELTRYSLVGFDEEKMRVHRLVMEVIKDALRKKGTYEEYEGYALEFGNKFYTIEFPTREKREEFERLYPHIEAIVRNCGQDERDVRVAWLCHFLGFGTDEILGAYDRALKWHEKAQVIEEKILGKEHPGTAAVYDNIASIYNRKGEYDTALEWLEKARVITEKVLGKEHSETAATYNNIACVYDNKGEYDTALEWYEKSLKISEKVFGKEHSETAGTYNNIAIAYKNKGEYDTALEWHEKARIIRENVLEKEHPDMAGTYNNIANVYISKGKYNTALKWCEKARVIREKVLGKEHPDTAGTYNSIAVAYNSKGEYDTALKWYEKSREIKENVFGKEHPFTVLTRKNIAECKAEALFHSPENIRVLEKSIRDAEEGKVTAHELIE